jgi:hypothetical protein
MTITEIFSPETPSIDTRTALDSLILEAFIAFIRHELGEHGRGPLYVARRCWEAGLLEEIHDRDGWHVAMAGITGTGKTRAEALRDWADLMQAKVMR